MACDVPLEKLRFFMFTELSEMKLVLHKLAVRVLLERTSQVRLRRALLGCTNTYFGRDEVARKRFSFVSKEMAGKWNL